MLPVRALFAAVAALMLTACNPVERANLARSEVESFHRDYNAANIGAIWSRVDPQFRNSTTRKDFENLMASVHNSMGDMKDSQQVGINMNSTPQGSLTVVTMRTSFEHGDGLETFTYIAKDDGLTLLGYNINAEKLMSDMLAKSANPEPAAAD